jgi:REP element-mobilizing transposase RayT
MARPLRMEFAGALYHVTSRGDGREAIYLDDKDREVFYAVLGEVCSRFNWCVHAECQMTNHYHLLVETPDGESVAGDAPAEWRVHPTLQSPTSAGGPRLSGSLQSDHRGEGDLSSGTGTLHRAQPGSRQDGV